MADYIKINPLDNVIIALKDFSKGEIIDLEGTKLEVLNDVPRA